MKELELEVNGYVVKIVGRRVIVLWSTEKPREADFLEYDDTPTLNYKTNKAEFAKALREYRKFGGRVESIYTLKDARTILRLRAAIEARRKAQDEIDGIVGEFVGTNEYELSEDDGIISVGCTELDDEFLDALSGAIK